MSKQESQLGFGTFFDPSKTTSGARFFRDLCKALAAEALTPEENPSVMLFNVSAPWQEIVRAKWRGKKVVLRVDGLYCDRLSPAFLKKFNAPMRVILGLGLRYRSMHNFMAHIANFFKQNYGGFLRTLLADQIIYQSNYSRQVHQSYFPNKPSDIVVNGSNLRAQPAPYQSLKEGVRFVTIYDGWRPSKRMYDVVRFVVWLNEEKAYPARLTILGFTGELPDSAPDDMGELIEAATYIVTKPRFNKFDSEVAAELFRSDIYLSFSYRDSCPNAVVESMAHGLPVLGLASGGVPDIVGDAGRLLPMDDFTSGLFDAGCYEYDFPKFDFEKVYAAMREMLDEIHEYRQRVVRRFENELEINVVAEKYAKVLRKLAAE